MNFPAKLSMAAVTDLCNKKRLVLVCGVFFIVTIVTVSLQAHWTYTSQLEQQLIVHKSRANSSCGKLEIKVLGSCYRCPREELRSEEVFCMETGYKQWVECGDGRKVYNWCDITPAVEERQFWIFELVALIITGISYSIVYIRQRKNDQLMMDKINRQIGLTA